MTDILGNKRFLCSSSVMYSQWVIGTVAQRIVAVINVAFNLCHLSPENLGALKSTTIPPVAVVMTVQ
jgi:hypothetical protein